MSSIMNPVIDTLGLEKANMYGKVIAVEEQHGCDGTFLLSSIISNAIKKRQGVCLVLYHNTFSHYHNVGMRLGYNMSSLKEKGQITVVEPMKDIATVLEDICEQLCNESDLIFGKTNVEAPNVYNHFAAIRDKYYEVAKHHDSVVLVIDDLSHLCDLGLRLSEVTYFLRCLKSLVKLEGAELCISTHSFQGYSQNCTANAIVNNLRHTAHLFVSIEPLQTGYSNNASGKLTVTWKLDPIKKQICVPERATYLYKLMDRQVKIYAPGMVGTIL